MMSMVGFTRVKKIDKGLILHLNQKDRHGQVYVKEKRQTSFFFCI